jgi:acetylglutamate synthase
MNSLLSSIYHHVDSLDTAMQPSAGSIENGSRTFEPVRIAILDSGFDPKNSLLINDDQRLDPRIKGVQNFVHGTESWDIQDEIGHGTHALGLLLKVATCAEIYIARVANQETLGRDSYDAIAKARFAPYQSKFYTYANGSDRRSITQSLNGM